MKAGSGIGEKAVHVVFSCSHHCESSIANPNKKKRKRETRKSENAVIVMTGVKARQPKAKMQLKQKLDGESEKKLFFVCLLSLPPPRKAA
jgi:hypothetical protein